MPDTSGPSSVVSSLKWNPAMWSSRTSLVCSLQDGAWVIEQASLFGTTPLATFSETFPRWGSMHDGRVFAHPTPERVTNDSASSSLHTPTTGDTAPTYDHRASPGYTRAIPVPNLAAQVDAMLPTPDAMGSITRSAENLETGHAVSLPRRITELASRGDDTKPESEGGNE